MSGKNGAGDEGDEDEEGIIELPLAESLPISTEFSTVPTTTDQLMFTPEFRRYFVKYVPNDTLMTLRFATKGYLKVADAYIDEGVKSSTIMVHNGDGNYLEFPDGSDDENDNEYIKLLDALEVKNELVTRIIFLLNVI
ncbi:hypothetical protein TL16_g04045 [Triparma laevis f. inornata]|uniref:Uncharacterized protein n=1 Tax=Triparma laevis f. inornata TaxID=1714386 RepID=A0A9W7ABI6_9STRA|nr:hypothetical protein TL16_g04045 [Triparma laevis f. inornata]